LFSERFKQPSVALKFLAISVIFVVQKPGLRFPLRYLRCLLFKMPFAFVCIDCDNDDLWNPFRQVALFEINLTLVRRRLSSDFPFSARA
jgi:hypothetical protein